MENRFSGAMWYKSASHKKVLVAGLGATGSFLAFFLARAGVANIRLVDFDSYEPHNLGSQLASYSSIGMNKATACSNFLNSHTNIPYITTTTTTIQEVSYTTFYSDVIVATIDRMDARKYMFENFLTYSPAKALFIDTRISAEYWEVYAITRENTEHHERYKATLFDDSQGNVGACNYQQSSHSAAGAAIQATELFTNHLNNILLEEDYLPFKVSKDLRTQNIQYEY